MEHAFLDGLIMTTFRPKLCIMIYKSPVKFEWVVVAKSLTFPPLVPGPEYHGQTEVRIKVKFDLHWN